MTELQEEHADLFHLIGTVSRARANIIACTTTPKFRRYLKDSEVQVLVEAAQFCYKLQQELLLVSKSNAIKHTEDKLSRLNEELQNIRRATPS